MFKDRIRINPDRVKALIFDFDGVILDSVDIKTESFRELLKDHPAEALEKFIAFHLEHGGVSRYVKLEHFFKEILKRQPAPGEIDALAQRFSEISFQKVLQAQFIPGAREFLEGPAGQFQCFVVSGTPETELRKVVEQRGIGPSFLEVLGSPTTKEAHIRTLLEKYRLKPSETVFIGDSVTDFKAALETGVGFILIPKNP